MVAVHQARADPRRYGVGVDVAGGRGVGVRVGLGVSLGVRVGVRVGRTVRVRVGVADLDVDGVAVAAGFAGRAPARLRPR